MSSTHVKINLKNLSAADIDSVVSTVDININNYVNISSGGKNIAIVIYDVQTELVKTTKDSVENFFLSVKLDESNAKHSLMNTLLGKLFDAVKTKCIKAGKSVPANATFSLGKSFMAWFSSQKPDASGIRAFRKPLTVNTVKGSKITEEPSPKLLSDVGNYMQLRQSYTSTLILEPEFSIRGNTLQVNLTCHFIQLDVETGQATTYTGSVSAAPATVDVVSYDEFNSSALSFAFSGTYLNNKYNNKRFKLKTCTASGELVEGANANGYINFVLSSENEDEAKFMKLANDIYESALAFCEANGKDLKSYAPFAPKARIGYLRIMFRNLEKTPVAVDVDENGTTNAVACNNMDDLRGLMNENVVYKIQLIVDPSVSLYQDVMRVNFYCTSMTLHKDLARSRILDIATVDFADEDAKDDFMGKFNIKMLQEKETTSENERIGVLTYDGDSDFKVRTEWLSLDPHQSSDLHYDVLDHNKKECDQDIGVRLFLKEDTTVMKFLNGLDNLINVEESNMFVEALNAANAPGEKAKVSKDYEMTPLVNEISDKVEGVEDRDNKRQLRMACITQSDRGVSPTIITNIRTKLILHKKDGTVVTLNSGKRLPEIKIADPSKEDKEIYSLPSTPELIATRDNILGQFKPAFTRCKHGNQFRLTFKVFKVWCLKTKSGRKYDYGVKFHLTDIEVKENDAPASVAKVGLTLEEDDVKPASTPVPVEKPAEEQPATTTTVTAEKKPAAKGKGRIAK